MRQLAESQSALGAVVASDVASRKTWRRRAGPKAVKRWARLVRGKVAGELLGLSIAAMIAPCVGAIVVQLFHLAFWRLGAASARVDAAAEPAPLPPKLARTIATADALVLFFAALGAFGHNAAARGTGAALFGSAALLVSADAVLKARARRRPAAPAARFFRLEDLPPIGVKGRGSNAPQMSTAIRPATATRAAVAAPVDTSQRGAVETNARVWAEQWWPLAFAAHTSKTEPCAIQLLGAPLVIWWDDSESGGGEAKRGVGGGGDQADGGVWRVTLDRCPHRLAPLSEGRVSEGCLECPYHGWSFDGAGQCVRVPQQEDGATYNSRRAAVTVLPCVERQGIIWAWAGALFEGALTSPPAGDDGPATVAELEREGVAHTDYSRDLHMDWSTLCENVMDPAHLPFTHHKVRWHATHLTPQPAPHPLPHPPQPLSPSHLSTLVPSPLTPHP